MSWPCPLLSPFLCAWPLLLPRRCRCPCHVPCPPWSCPLCRATVAIFVPVPARTPLAVPEAVPGPRGRGVDHRSLTSWPQLLQRCGCCDAFGGFEGRCSILCAYLSCKVPDLPELRPVWDSSHLDRIARPGAEGHISSPSTSPAYTSLGLESSKPPFFASLVSPFSRSSLTFARTRSCRVDLRWEGPQGAARASKELAETRLQRSAPRNS